MTYVVDDDGSDGHIVVGVSINESTRQFNICIQKSLEVENENVSSMIQNTVTMLSEFMLLTKYQQRSVIDSCKNISELETADQRPALRLVNINES